MGCGSLVTSAGSRRRPAGADGIEPGGAVGNDGHPGAVCHERLDSGGGAFPPLNVFRKGDDFIIIAELPGVKKSDLDVQVKGRTVIASAS